MKTPDEIRDLLRNRLFKHSVIQNNFRGELVEEIIASEICSNGWIHCSDDWASWDFRRDDQLVQVKSAAARQSWDRAEDPLPKRNSNFAIRPNSGYYIGSSWKSLEKPARLAQIYIFAWHDDATASADHYDFDRWTFFVTPTSVLNNLDEPKRPKAAITVAELQRAAGSGDIQKVRIDCLANTIEAMSKICPNASIELPRQDAPGRSR